MKQQPAKIGSELAANQSEQPGLAPKATKKEEPQVELKAKAPYEPTELVIKEIMVQKGVSRDEALAILKGDNK
jgi:hypothetical protein